MPRGSSAASISWSSRARLSSSLWAAATTERSGGGGMAASVSAVRRACLYNAADVNRIARSPQTATERATLRATVTLVTGAGGEVGHGLLGALHAAGGRDIVAFDLRGLDPRQRAL